MNIGELEERDTESAYTPLGPWDRIRCWKSRPTWYNEQVDNWWDGTGWYYSLANIKDMKGPFSTYDECTKANDIYTREYNKEVMKGNLFFFPALSGAIGTWKDLLKEPTKEISVYYIYNSRGYGYYSFEYFATEEAALAAIPIKIERDKENGWYSTENKYSVVKSIERVNVELDNSQK